MAYNPNPAEPSGLMPDVKEEVKEEPHEDEVSTSEVLAISIITFAP